MSLFPEEFQRAMQKKLGTGFPDFLASLQLPAPVSIRLNPRKNPAHLSGKPVGWSDYGRYLSARPSFTFDPFLHTGTYYVQEASSMFLEQAFRQSVDLSRSINVLDLSAAPGGKSTHILSLINPQSLLVSNEVIRSRAMVLKENVQKWGYPNVVVTNNDPKDFEALGGFFDVMVIDAPCSGEGLFRKDPGAVLEWSPQHVSLCASRQKRILTDAWHALKENGILIYCTCTYNESENQDNLQWLSEQHAVEFLKLKLEDKWGVEEVITDTVTGYQFFPHKVSGEGFFISVLKKKETSRVVRAKVKERQQYASRKITDTLRSWIIPNDTQQFFQYEEKIYFMPEAVSTSIEFLKTHLKIINAGTALATVKHDKVIPEHPAALSTYLNPENFNRIALNKEDTIRFLRKDQLAVNEYEKGYALIVHENTPVGWVNVLDNRINNLYPPEWRIRMAPPPGSRGQSSP